MSEYMLWETIDEQKRKIADLEKENTELKGLKDVATLIRANNDTVVTLMQLNNMLVSKSQQLAKAKEIIRELLSSCYGYNSKTVNYEVKAKAEAFLKKDDNCPDMLCEDCTKTDCNIRELGLVPDKKE